MRKPVELDAYVRYLKNRRKTNDLVHGHDHTENTDSGGMGVSIHDLDEKARHVPKEKN